MLRSEVNRYLKEAERLFARHQFLLPRWACYSAQEWRKHPELAKRVALLQMGWDITDFGSGDFFKRGLVLFCVRNGVLGEPEGRPYAEKIMVVRPNQETPLHYHALKMEDIINRGGGRLAFHLHGRGKAAGSLSDQPLLVRVDEREVRLKAGEKLLLEPGESLSVPRFVYHRFYAEGGEVLCGEVSQVNDDRSDNYFFEALGRFAAIEEDEPALYPLWQELVSGA